MRERTLDISVCRLLAHHKLSLGVTRHFYIAKLIGALLTEIIEATSNHDLRLARTIRALVDAVRHEGSAGKRMPTEEVHACMIHDILLIPTTDILVVNRVTCLRINPAPSCTGRSLILV
jgi:hypothetical protein